MLESLSAPMQVLVIVSSIVFWIVVIYLIMKHRKPKADKTGKRNFDSATAGKIGWTAGVIIGIIVTLIVRNATGLMIISVLAGTAAIFVAVAIITTVLSSGSKTVKNISLAEECEKNNLHPLESDVDFQRMKLLAKNKEHKNLTDEEYRKLYSEGIRMLRENEKIDQDTENNQKQRTGHENDLRQKSALEKFGGIMYISTTNFDGRVKRRAMINEKLKELKTEKKNLEAYLDSMKHPHKSDPYIHGGIASGIAGPVAGAMAAADVAASNEKAKAGAAANYALFGGSVEGKIAKLESEIKVYQNASSKNEIALSTGILPENEAGNMMTAKFIETEKTEGGSLHIRIGIQPIQETTVQNLPAVLDGAMTAKVLINGTPVDECRLVLPLNGVDCHHGAVLEGLCTKMPSGFNKEECEVTVAADRIWLIENNALPYEPENIIGA